MNTEDVKRYLREGFPDAVRIDFRTPMNDYEGKVFVVLDVAANSVYRAFIPKRCLDSHPIDRLALLGLSQHMKEVGPRMVAVDNDCLTTRVTDERI
jgi:hypothetical protein